VLPGRTLANHRVVVFRPNKIGSAEGLAVNEYQRMGAFVLEETMSADNMLMTLLVDVSGITLTTLWQFSASDVGRGVRMWMDRYPVKLRSILIINAGHVVRGFFHTLVSPLLPEKIRGRVLFVSFPATLHALLPASMLPRELVGCEGTLDGFDWRKLVEDGSWVNGGESREEVQ
jgi:hypothetical protein